MKFKKSIAVAGVALTGLLATGCSTAADTASRNLHYEAEGFELNRRIIFFNGITDKYLLTIEGRCSVETDEGKLGGSLEVTCKVAENAYKKHFLGLSDNVSFFVEQIDTADVSVYHYKVLLRPETLIPSVDLEMGEQ